MPDRLRLLRSPEEYQETLAAVRKLLDDPSKEALERAQVLLLIVQEYESRQPPGPSLPPEEARPEAPTPAPPPGGGPERAAEVAVPAQPPVTEAAETRKRPTVSGRPADLALSHLLAVALLLHFVALYACTVLGYGSSRADFFSSQVEETKAFDLTSVVLSSTPPPQVARTLVPAPIPEAGVPTLPAGRARRPGMVGGAPRRPTAEVRPTPGSPARPAVTQPAVTQPAVTQPAVVRPSVISGGGPGVAAMPDQARPPASGTGGTQPSGRSAGSPPQGGGPASAPPEGNAGRDETVVLCSQWLHVHYARPEPDDLTGRPLNVPRPAEPKNWEELCEWLGITMSDLRSRSSVSPFLTRFKYAVPDMSQLKALLGVKGQMEVRVTVSAQGRPNVQITSSSGNSLMDHVGFYVMERSHWMPGLAYGQPVARQVDLRLVFDSVPENPSGTMQAGAGGDGWAPVVNRSDVRPGGTPGAPNAPGGAGQLPGSS